MTLAAEIVQTQEQNLEQRREGWRISHMTEQTRKHEWKREHARRTFGLFKEWSLKTGRVNRREFMVWLTGEQNPSTQMYDYINAGFALDTGFDYDLGISALAFVGRALEKHGWEEVQALLESGGPEAVRALVVKQRQEGLVKLPVSELPGVRETISRVSESEHVPADQALALIVQGHDALPLVEQQGVLEAARTGSSMTYGTGQVVARLLDPVDWIKAQQCLVPGCLLPSEHLHHLKLDGTRFRSQNVEIPLCSRHHIAEPGLSSVAAHAAKQPDWIARFWLSETEFWRDVASLYAQRLFGDGFGYNALDPQAAQPMLAAVGE